MYHFFTKKVDRRSRSAMVEFLSNHFRYHSMSSWNGVTTYANVIKIQTIGLTPSQLGKAFTLLDVDYWNDIRWPIDHFTESQGDQYTISCNGRSGGYLILNRSCRELTGHKSYCPSCGQRNFKLVESSFDLCGVCHKPRSNFDISPSRLSVYAGKNIDQHEDFHIEDWSMDALRQRVDLICAFDQACDQIRSNFIALLDEFEVVEETIYKPVHVKFLKRAA